MAESLFFLFLVLAWSLSWKGVALWRAARNGHKKWFIALLLVNALAIPEIAYIFFFSKKKEIIISSSPGSEPM